MFGKIMEFIQGKNLELKERMFRTIIFLGGTAATVGVVESFLMEEMVGYQILVFILLLIAMSVAMAATFKYKKYDLSAMIMAVVIVEILFPIKFFLSGGLQGGPTIWFVLGIIYIFVVFKGKKLYVFLLLSIVTYGATYIIGYMNPELVHSLHSSKSAYMDSFFSVIAVGAVAGFLIKMYLKLFEEEHKLNLARKEEIEKNSSSKNALFANMNHEIRTPINAIIGLNEMILRSEISDEVKDYAKDINVASKMLLSQVNDILDLSQMEMGRMKIVPVKYNTARLMTELVELVRFQMEKKGLEFLVEIDSNMPSVLYGDEKKIKQVLLNILDNAKKYTERGSVIFTVRAEEGQDGNVILEMKIADTGIGIKKEDLDYIYESFNRFDEKENQRILGSGLGLAITKQLVDLMNGEITVDSIYKKGTVFTVKIGQEIVDSKPIGNIKINANQTGNDEVYRTSFEAPEVRILVVDDNKMNSKVVNSLLLATKMKIDIADSGYECLELTKKKYYNIILLDYMMPGMDGLETLKNIRRQENGMCRETAVIALTGNVASGARQMYLNQGFDGYVEKPIQSRKLEEEILKFLPPDSIEYCENAAIEVENISQIQRFTVKKRKKIYVTTDCVCDIPGELLEKYDIALMYLYIKTPYGRFADTREIDSDSVKQYISVDDSNAYGDAVTVEEYEEFFSEVLTEAERVIHISLGTKIGRAHSIAVAAAKGFDHVHVIDSGIISCGQGLLVLHAARMALEGKSYDEICQSVENVKNRIEMRFIMPSADIFYKNGRTTATVAKLCRKFQLHPYLSVRQNRIKVIGLLNGTLENAWKVGVRKQLRNKRKICRDIVFITHAGCSVEQLEYVVDEVKKMVEFDQIIVQKASFSSACITGLESIGISYYEN